MSSKLIPTRFGNVKKKRSERHSNDSKNGFGKSKGSPQKGQTSKEQSFKGEQNSSKGQFSKQGGSASKGQPSLAQKSNKLLVGAIKRHPDGFGFFIPDQKDFPDVYIPKHSMVGVMTGDRVMIEVFPEKNSDRFRGEIVRVMSRGLKNIVGRISFDPIGKPYIEDESGGWGQNLSIDIKKSLKADIGELVVVEIITYPDSQQAFSGKIVEIIGNGADPLNDIKRVLAQHQIPTHFSKATIEEAQEFTPNPTEIDFKGREDLRRKNLITIDGATAKDFDDAVLVEVDGKGFKLWVAIADVSHYVTPGSSIDHEAYERGTSVYFPNFVVPMLPEELSNGLCSLNPHVPRLCVVSEIHFDFEGNATSSRFYEAVMESKARATYGEAQEVIDGGDVKKLIGVRENILRCADLARILLEKRMKEGSLELEIPETEIEIDASGVPVDIIRSERLFAHRVIEELMLSANVAVAKFLSQKNIPALFRVHEPPREEALQMLEKYLWNFGGRVKLGENRLQKRIRLALEEFAGKPEHQVLNILTLRSMSQARYHSENLGHFGLNFDHYTHFTSPIRRYPDLIVHRLLKSQVVNQNTKHSGKAPRYQLMETDDLTTAGQMLSACEQRAAKAERQVVSIKKARFLSKFVGQEFDGMISSVVRFGVFVLLRNYDVDGLIKLENLSSKDKFEFDDENLLLKSRTGTVYRIGDSVRILVTSTDIDAGQINFSLVSPENPNARAALEKSKAKAPGGTQMSRPQKKPNQSGNQPVNSHSNRTSNQPANQTLNQSTNQSKEQNFESGKSGKSNRKNSKKRGKTEDDRRSLRETRVSSGRRKG